MRYSVLLLLFVLFSGCDNIGLDGAYPSISTQNSPECGCGGVMYKISNPNPTAQKVTVVRVRQSGTAPKRRDNLQISIQPKIEKRLGCSEINLFITGRSEFCDTHQSFYVKKYTELSK